MGNTIVQRQSRVRAVMKKCWVLLLVLLVVSLFIGNVVGIDHDDDKTQVIGVGDGGGGRCDTDQDCNNNGQCEPIEGQRGVCRCDERYAGAPWRWPPNRACVKLTLVARRSVLP